jgi:hypothetical protein
MIKHFMLNDHLRIPFQTNIETASAKNPLEYNILLPFFFFAIAKNKYICYKIHAGTPQNADRLRLDAAAFVH